MAILAAPRLGRAPMAIAISAPDDHAAMNITPLTVLGHAAMAITQREPIAISWREREHQSIL